MFRFSVSACLLDQKKQGEKVDTLKKVQSKQASSSEVHILIEHKSAVLCIYLRPLAEADTQIEALTFFVCFLCKVYFNGRLVSSKRVAAQCGGSTHIPVNKSSVFRQPQHVIRRSFLGNVVADCFEDWAGRLTVVSYIDDLSPTTDGCVAVSRTM